MASASEPLTAEEAAYVQGLHDASVDEDALERLVLALLDSVERKAGMEVVA